MDYLIEDKWKGGNVTVPNKIISLNETLTHLDIHLGDKCNCRCTACECWHVREPMDLPKNVLWPKIEEVLSYLESNCLNFDKLMLIGGEPFAHVGLADFLCQQKFGIYLVVYTNFAIPISNNIWPHNIHFITSMDAPDRETYCEIRGIDAFSITMENIRHHRHRLIHVDTTVSRLNLKKLDSILELTENIGCTHWFLPIDARVIRFAKKKDSRIPNSIVKRLENILLQDSDLLMVKEFFQRHKKNKRINTFEMFEGIYLSSLLHFSDLYANDDEKNPESIQKLQRPMEHCPAIERYLEIRLDNMGYYVPVIHCPLLQERYPQSSVKAFKDFSQLVSWVSEIRSRLNCDYFCGRTQFLSLDDYKDLFSEVKRRYCLSR